MTNFIHQSDCASHIQTMLSFITHVDSRIRQPTEEAHSLNRVVKARLHIASASICEEFDDLVEATTDCLKDKKVTPTELSAFVLNKLERLRWDYPADLPDKLQMCKELCRMFYELEHCEIIVFFDIGILECIIKKYCGPKTKDLLKAYSKELDKYLMMRIRDNPLFQENAEVTPDSVPQNGKLYLFMDDTWTKDLPQKKLYRLQRRVANVLQSSRFELIGIWVGSFYICYKVLKKDFTICELQIDQVLKLINFGVAGLQEHSSGCKYSMEETCKYACILLCSIKDTALKHVDFFCRQKTFIVYVAFTLDTRRMERLVNLFNPVLM